MVVLTDDQEDWNYRPTGKNMLAAFGWLVTNNYPGDSLFLHYSGHGLYCSVAVPQNTSTDRRIQEGRLRIRMVIVKVDSTIPFAPSIMKPKGSFQVILYTEFSSPHSPQGLDSPSYSIAAIVSLYLFSFPSSIPIFS